MLLCMTITVTYKGDTKGCRSSGVLHEIYLQYRWFIRLPLQKTPILVCYCLIYVVFDKWLVRFYMYKDHQKRSVRDNSCRCTRECYKCGQMWLTKSASEAM